MLLKQVYNQNLFQLHVQPMVQLAQMELDRAVIRNVNVKKKILFFFILNIIINNIDREKDHNELILFLRSIQIFVFIFFSYIVIVVALSLFFFFTRTLCVCFLFSFGSFMIVCLFVVIVISRKK
jgi:hypothetical protein